MDAFKQLNATVVAIETTDIDTDQIIPAIFLKTTSKIGLGKNLFSHWRFNEDGSPKEDFIINTPEAQGAEILLAGDNFGCGSSREHAPWAIKDFGIRCMISTSFADIFFNNCFKNGLLPITLPKAEVDFLMEDAQRGANAIMSVDLRENLITSSDGTKIEFEVDPTKRHNLLNGLDDIGLTLEKTDLIEAYEVKAQSQFPWMHSEK
ncbi:MAG: 3-isopropylmalate dehydratase small subunit, partial [Pseudomonadota bacterium]